MQMTILTLPTSEVAVGPTFWILQRTPAPLGALFFTTSTPLGAELARARSQWILHESGSKLVDLAPRGLSQRVWRLAGLQEGKI